MSVVIDMLRKKALESAKAKDSVASVILRLAQGEVQMLEVRLGRDTTEEEAFGAIRKLVKSNEETLLSSEGEKAQTLKREIEILSALLPKGPSADELAAVLAEVADAIRAAPADGPATGAAMKHLKVKGITASGADVTAAVKKIRG
jgi:uncharacterized protein YqeY